MQGTGLRAHAHLCSATQAVKCAVALLSPSSLASVSLRFLSYCNSSHSFLVAIFHMCFSLFSHGILGVVFTHPVGYSRPPSAVNDPTVIKQVNSENHASNKCPNHFFIKFPCSISTWFISMETFIGIRSPP